MGWDERGLGHGGRAVRGPSNSTPSHFPPSLHQQPPPPSGSQRYAEHASPLFGLTLISCFFWVSFPPSASSLISLVRGARLLRPRQARGRTLRAPLVEPTVQAFHGGCKFRFWEGKWLKTQLDLGGDWPGWKGRHRTRITILSYLSLLVKNHVALGKRWFLLNMLA